MVIPYGPARRAYNQKWRDTHRAHVRQRQLLNNCRTRARKKNLLCTITIEDIKIPDKCPILGITLIAGFDTGRASSPSVDQIEVGKGYTPENIQVISYLANQMKSNGTLEQCVALGDWARRQLEVPSRS